MTTQPTTFADLKSKLHAGLVDCPPQNATFLLAQQVVNQANLLRTLLDSADVRILADVARQVYWDRFASKSLDVELIGGAIQAAISEGS